MLKHVLFAVMATCCFVASSIQGQIVGSSSSNPAGGSDINVVASKTIGQPDHNMNAGVFASTNTKENIPTVGGFANYNIKDHVLGVSRTHTPGVSDTFSQNVGINLLKNDNHRLDATAFNSHTKLNSGFEFDKRGGALEYNHARGHGASLGASHIPNFGTTAELSGRANLWRSNNGLSSLDLTGNAARTFGGPFNGRNNFGAGLGFARRF